MQILIDSATETPRSLLVASRLISLWAAELVLLEGGEPSSINGAGDEITLTTTETHTIGDISHTVTHAAAKRPTPPPVGPSPAPGPVAPLPPGNLPPAPVVHPERHPDAPEPDAPDAPDMLDPKVVFGRFGNVPAGTTVDPPHAAPDAPAAPVTNAGAVAAVGTSGASPAPITQGANTAAPAGPVSADRDKAGVPWDARVHSETRKTNADGTWRYRRNLDAAVKAAVTAELKAAASTQVALPPGQPANGVASGVPLSPDAPPVPQQPVAAAAVPDPPGPTVGDVPSPPVTLPGALPLPAAANVGVPDPPNAGVVPAAVTSFRELMTKINVARANGKLTQEQMEAACRAAGVDSVTALAAQPLLVPQVDQYVNRYIGVAA